MSIMDQFSDALRGKTNLADKERLALLTAGAASVMYGLRRRGVLGLTAAAGGAYLARAAFRKNPDLHKQFTVRMTIDKPRQELYDFWHGFTNLPRVMQHVEEIHETGDGRTHWVMRPPGGMKLEWDSEVTQDIPGREIAWRTVPDTADIHNDGRVRFSDAPRGRGTEVELYLSYDAPGGLISSAVGNFVNKATKEVAKSDLRRFKRMVESGEIATGARPGAQPGQQQKPSIQ